MTLRKFFPGGNTYAGFYSYYDFMWPNEDTRRIILKGGPGTGKSTLMKKISAYALEKGYNSEEFWCSSDPNSLDGVVIPEKNLGLVDGTAPHCLDPVYPGVRDHLLALGDCWDREKLQKNQGEIIRLTQKNSECFVRAYNFFAESYTAYTTWKYYQQRGCDDKMIRQESRLLAHTFLSDAKSSETPARHLFAAAITPEGPVSFAESLFTPEYKIWGLKGGPGSGVKAVLQNIADQAKLNSIPLEIYHCPFIPNDIDILIEPQNKTALVDISSPIVHYMQKLSQSDFKGICNMEEFFNTAATEPISIYITEAGQRFLNLLKSGILMLKSAKTYHDELETFYIQAMHFDQVKLKTDELIEKFL